MVRSLVLMAALLVGAASAHAYLERAEPQRYGLVTATLEEVRLVFSEPVEVRFSTFKVYRLELDDEAMPEDLANPTERERQRISALAAALVSEVLEDQGDEEARADAGVLSEARTSAEVSLALRENLEPDVYVVMWRTLSIDTHWTEDFYVFFLAPEVEGG